MGQLPGVQKERVSGLAEYPGYYCYDANRPSWLPYWVPDLTELSCETSLSTIAGNLTACLSSSPTCGVPPNPNPAVSGPGAGGPALSSGDSTASDQPIGNALTDNPLTTLMWIGLGLLGLMVLQDLK